MLESNQVCQNESLGQLEAYAIEGHVLTFLSSCVRYRLVYARFEYRGYTGLREP